MFVIITFAANDKPGLSKGAVAGIVVTGVVVVGAGIGVGIFVYKKVRTWNVFLVISNIITVSSQLSAF